MLGTTAHGRNIESNMRVLDACDGTIDLTENKEIIILIARGRLSSSQ